MLFSILRELEKFLNFRNNPQQSFYLVSHPSHISLPLPTYFIKISKYTSDTRARRVSGASSRVQTTEYVLRNVTHRRTLADTMETVRTVTTHCHNRRGCLRFRFVA